jgi:hypothetical protein
VLVVRDAVQLANQLIDFPVGGGDFAVQSWSGEVLIGGGGGCGVLRSTTASFARSAQAGAL